MDIFWCAQPPSAHATRYTWYVLRTRTTLENAIDRHKFRSCPMRLSCRRMRKLEIQLAYYATNRPTWLSWHSRFYNLRFLKNRRKKSSTWFETHNFWKQKFHFSCSIHWKTNTRDIICSTRTSNFEAYFSMRAAHTYIWNPVSPGGSSEDRYVSHSLHETTHIYGHKLQKRAHDSWTRH